MFIIIASIIIFIAGMFILVNVLNADLYGRLIETKSFNAYFSSKENDNALPTIILVLHKYLYDENSVEASIIMTVNVTSMPLNEFIHKNDSSLVFDIKISDGYNYIPLNSCQLFSFTYNIKNEYNRDFGFETNKFQLPIAHSLNGFPFDNIEILPYINTEINGLHTNYNFKVQNRIPGRLLFPTDRDDKIIELTRTSTEKYFVMISSGIFILLTIILTYSLFSTKNGLTKTEEVITIAGYILAIAGFRDLIGITRNNGTNALEIIVILIPLLLVFTGFVYSFYIGRKKHNKRE